MEQRVQHNFKTLLQEMINQTNACVNRLKKCFEANRKRILKNLFNGFLWMLIGWISVKTEKTMISGGISFYTSKNGSQNKKIRAFIK